MCWQRRRRNKCTNRFISLSPSPSAPAQHVVDAGGQPKLCLVAAVVNPSWIDEHGNATSFSSTVALHSIDSDNLSQSICKAYVDACGENEVATASFPDNVDKPWPLVHIVR